MPRSESGEREENIIESNRGNNLYVSNLSYRTKEEDLHELFGKHGKIKYCKVVRDPVSNESRGFGFVTFEEPADAKEALEHLEKTEIGGRAIHVEEAKRPRPYSPTPGRYLGQAKFKRTELKRGGGGGDRRRSPSPRRHRRRSPSRSRSRSPPRRRPY